MLAPSRAPPSNVHHLTQQQHPAFRAGVDAAEARQFTTGNNMTMYNRRVGNISRPRHQLGFEFVMDREKEKVNPCRAIPNAPTSPEVLANMARPDLPPRMFGL
jgi:hypothetical protein